MKNRKGRKLSRKKANRNHLIRNLATQLFIHGRIKTTLAKAKTVKPEAERLVKYALGTKEQMINNRRYLQGYFFDRKAVDGLMKKYKSELTKQKGGYCRIIKLKNRLGDNTPMALLDLNVDDEKKTHFKTIEERKKKSDEKEGKKPTSTEPSDNKKKSFWDRFKKQEKDSKEETVKKEKPAVKAKDLPEKESTQRTTSK